MPVNVTGQTTIACTVRALFSDTYGKMPDEGADYQIFMEYKYFTDTLANQTNFSNDGVPLD